MGNQLISRRFEVVNGQVDVLALGNSTISATYSGYTYYYYYYYAPQAGTKPSGQGALGISPAVEMAHGGSVENSKTELPPLPTVLGNPAKKRWISTFPQRRRRLSYRHNFQTTPPPAGCTIRHR
ncbi:MAG TPA: hypothetical protein VFC10_09035 [Terriglobia bacterium]|nr:hypothetical protein [Terriglobia bacterium]